MLYEVITIMRAIPYQLVRNSIQQLVELLDLFLETGDLGLELFEALPLLFHDRFGRVADELVVAQLRNNFV